MDINIDIWCWIYKYASEIGLGSFGKRLEFRLMQVFILLLFYLFMSTYLVMCIIFIEIALCVINQLIHLCILIFIFVSAWAPRRIYITIYKKVD